MPVEMFAEVVMPPRPAAVGCRLIAETVRVPTRIAPEVPSVDARLRMSPTTTPQVPAASSMTSAVVANEVLVITPIAPPLER